MACKASPRSGGIKGIAVFAVLVLLGTSSCFGGGGEVNAPQVSPRGKAALQTLMTLGMLRLKIYHPEEVAAAKAAAKAVAQGLRLVAAENNLLASKELIDKAIAASGVDKEKLHPEARFWIDALPELAALYALPAEDGADGGLRFLDKERMLRLADKIDELADKV